LDFNLILISQLANLSDIFIAKSIEISNLIRIFIKILIKNPIKPFYQEFFKIFIR